MPNSVVHRVAARRAAAAVAPMQLNLETRVDWRALYRAPRYDPMYIARGVRR